MAAVVRVFSSGLNVEIHNSNCAIDHGRRIRLCGLLLLLASSVCVFCSWAQERSSGQDPQQFTLQNGDQGKYVGMFADDGKFRRPSKTRRFVDRHTISARSPDGRAEAPPRMLRAYARSLQDYAPPAHAMALPETHSLPVRALHGVVTLAYGHRKLLVAPQRVISDSRQRVIVSDPGAPAVHVLDPNGVNSFSILAGHGCQLEQPGPVAVDAEDNIYIGDPSRAIVLVYDRYGRFLRRIGEFHGENLYQSITGLAIDRKEQRLYLADGARHLVFILDLQGNELKRVGQSAQQRTDEGLTIRNDTGPREFNHPTDIAVGERAVVVLDSGGTRVRLMDLDGNLIGGFLAIHTAAERADGVGIDKQGNVYVSYITTAEIRVYSRDGLPLGSFGGAGFRFGEFYTPRGLWIDPMEQLHVVDGDNARIQIFQLTSPAAPHEAVVVSSAAE